LSTKILSIDVGSKMLHLVEGSKAGSRSVRVSKAYSLAVPAGCVENGAIMDRDAFIATLNKAMAEGQFNARKAILTAGNAAAIVRDIELPTVKSSMFDAMIRNEMLEVLGDEIYHIIEYRKLYDLVNEQGEKRIRFRVAAINFDTARSYWDILSEAGLYPLSMDVNANAADKLLAKDALINGLGSLRRGSFVALDFGYSGTHIQIYTDGQPDIIRQIPMGTRDMDSLISANTPRDALGTERLKKTELDLSRSDLDNTPMFMALKPFFLQWSNELRKVIQYHKVARRGKILKRVFLYGGGALIPGLPSYLTQTFDIPFEPFSSLNRVQNAKALGENGLITYLNAVGAIIRL
jgi:type IV pilus assembly protein PilM